MPDNDEHDRRPGTNNGDASERQAGLRRVINAGLISYERLPVLEIVFDRLVRTLSTSLRNLTGDNVEIRLDEITSLRFGSYMESVAPSSMLSVFSAEEWGDFGLMVIDASMIYSMIDVLLGGRSEPLPARTENRQFTTIERTLVEQVVRHILGDLSASFEPICSVTLRYQRTETDARFAAVSRPPNAVVVAKLRIGVGGGGGSFHILLPYALLEPVRDVLLQQFMGERLGRDKVWQRHLADELREITVELRAVLGERVVSLSQVLGLKVGSRVDFPVTSDDPVELRCGNVPLFLASAGNRRNRVAVQIDSKLPCNEFKPEVTSA